MAEDDDEVAALIAQLRGFAVDGCARVFEGDALPVAMGDQPFGRHGDARDADLHAVALGDEVGADEPFEHGAFAMVVAAQDGEVGRRDQLPDEVKAVVELVVAQRGGQQLLLVEAKHLQLSVEDVEVG